MSARPACAARSLYRDEHTCPPRSWTVTAPTGETYDICSGACLVSFATLGALPTDLIPCNSVQPAVGVPA